MRLCVCARALGKTTGSTTELDCALFAAAHYALIMSLIEQSAWRTMSKWDKCAVARAQLDDVVVDNQLRRVESVKCKLDTLATITPYALISNQTKLLTCT